MKTTTIFLSIILFALISGLCFDAGMKGFSMACGAIAMLCFSVLLQKYLDGDIKFEVSDKRYIRAE